MKDGVVKQSSEVRAPDGARVMHGDGLKKKYRQHAIDHKNMPTRGKK